MKYLLLGLLVVIVLMWLTRSKKVSSGASKSEHSASADPAVEGERMLQCAHCGTHIPASESVAAPSGAVFCSEEHRLRHARS